MIRSTDWEENAGTNAQEGAQSTVVRTQSREADTSPTYIQYLRASMNVSVAPKEKKQEAILTPGGCKT